MNNEEITALMIGGQEDGKFITTDGRPHVVIAVNEELPSYAEYDGVESVIAEFKTQLYDLIKLHGRKDYWVYQYINMEMDVIEALIKGYKGQP